MSNPVAVICQEPGVLQGLRWQATDWRLVGPADAERQVYEWREKARKNPRGWEVHLYEVDDAEAVAIGGLAGLIGGGGQVPCAPLPGPKVWFAELRQIEFFGWTVAAGIAWIPTPIQIEELKRQVEAGEEGGLYVERMAPQWYASAKNWLGTTVGGGLAGLANLVGEVFGTAALAFLKAIGPWALVLLAAWAAVKVLK